MLDTLVTVIVPLTVALGIAGTFFLKKPRWVGKFMADLEERYLEFTAPGVDAQGNETPSQLALMLDTAADRFGKQLAASVRGSLMGQISGDKRGEQAMVRDLAGAFMEKQNPLVAGALDQFFPDWKKFIAKHPQALPQILSMIQGGKGGLPSGLNTSESDFKKRLKEYG